ncbi:MAG: class I mannose-6-phosphate isomerase [Salinivirgaceae bacterium]|nr:class I mannose-6-phosphate isomerase [Salinivirgaceae bacterium]
MSTLYPIKFNPIFKEKIWGGQKLKNLLNKSVDENIKMGESWEISGVSGDLSVVENGFLQDNTIEELIEIYMGDLVGDKVYEQFGLEFPLLIKYIDANDYLSIQVHPDDDLARERHNSYGKTEMWYVIDAEKEAELIAGFNQEMDKTKYLQHFGSGTLREVLNFEKVKTGDVFFMPAGRVHATGPGILFAEIQQTSDITYRIYDWDRFGDDGKPREMHTELAIDAIDYNYHKEVKTPYKEEINKSSEIIKCPYFTTNIINLNSKVVKDYFSLDSFVIYMGIDGDTKITYSETEEIILKKGETLLIPAILPEIGLEPLSKESKILEVYID